MLDYTFKMLTNLPDLQKLENYSLDHYRVGLPCVLSLCSTDTASHGVFHGHHQQEAETCIAIGLSFDQSSSHLVSKWALSEEPLPFGNLG